MAEEEPDRLSELPDELLQHILHLAPCREAETTSLLSRRWRGLWPPPTGAVKIDIPSGDNIFPFHDALLRAAEEALAASHGPVQRLAIHVGQGCNKYVDVVGDVLSHPASHGVQDVRIRADASRDSRTAAGNDDDDDSLSNPSLSVGEFRFSFGCVPSAALRVLQLTNCSDLTPPAPASTFPCLEVLRLRRCMVALQNLQDMVDASPRLATLQLEYVEFFTTVATSPWLESFCCPGVTTLVIVKCSSERWKGVTIELDVPSVQHFRYRGVISQFTLRSPLPDVKRAYLHILDCNRSNMERCERFWSFLKNFSGTKVLKLKLEWPIDCVAALARRRIRDLLIGENHQSPGSIMFCVEHLEIDEPYNPESKDVGVAIGNLLQCCPALHDLRLKLNTVDQYRGSWSASLQSKAQMEFHKSIDHFRRRRDRPVVPLCGDNDLGDIIPDIPGLSDRCFHFSCLQFLLKRLSVQFRMDKDNTNCVGVRLVKFFIERGIALEEIYIDDGNMKLWEHMNCKIISRHPANHPQPFSEQHVLARMSRELSMNQFSFSSKISGWCHPHKLEVKRTKPWSTSRSFTILPLADK